MALALKRTDLQALAQAKLDDSHLLLANKRFSSAYYLAGFAVEFGLKACISRQFVSEAIPDRSFVTAIFNHDLKKLVNLAGLTKELKDAEIAHALFAANWALVTEWVPDVRYETVDAVSSELLLQAISEPNVGVFEWIKRYW